MAAQTKSMIENKNALKPKTKSFKTRVQRIKEDMGKIREDQICIREEQMHIGEKFGDVKRQCDELKLETELVVIQSAFNRIRLSIMFNILQARQAGDFDQAAALSSLLKNVSDQRKL